MKRYTLTNRKDLQQFIKDNNIQFMKMNEDESRQLRNCQAWIIPVYAITKDDKTYTGYILQSYYTAVAISLERGDDNIRVAFRKYSTTTSKQTTWFFSGYWD